MNNNRPADNKKWRAHWYEIIFEADTKPGRNFDIILLIAIIGSLLAVMLESIPSLSRDYRKEFRILEWFFTGIFTVEYILRILVVHRKTKYIFSFYGIIDFLSILPAYLSVILVGAQYFIVLRSLRLLRVFRVLKMVRFLGEARMLSSALKASRIKIIVFLVAVLCVIFIMGTLMHIVEGPENGFTSIPVSVYWCIVTLTTVGYGDISPQTPLGQVIASVIMIMGYGIIAVPTGIVTAEINRSNQTADDHKTCPNCSRSKLGADAQYCKYCGSGL